MYSKRSNSKFSFNAEDNPNALCGSNIFDNSDINKSYNNLNNDSIYNK